MPLPAAARPPAAIAVRCSGPKLTRHRSSTAWTGAPLLGATREVTVISEPGGAAPAGEWLVLRPRGREAGEGRSREGGAL
jgi:hypothetical protein